MITFYPTISYGELCKHAAGVERALFAASSWAGSMVRRHGFVPYIPTPTIPAGMTEIAADCGGFVATLKWGDYKYSDVQYVEWLRGWSVMPTWAAMMDYCCENEITSGKTGIVRERQQKTTAMAHHFWHTYRDEAWTWVPTVQGWDVSDYERHASELQPLIVEMQRHYHNSAFRVGIGTLCHRASSEMIREVVLSVARVLPGIPLHLWGVKLGVAKSSVALPESVVSFDSGAWNGMFGSRREEWKQSGLSQREWCFKVALPRYEAKVAAALSSHKQARMF